MTENKDLIKEYEDRCSNYALLSRLFRVEIDKELLSDLIENLRAEELGEPDFDNGFARMRKHLDNIEDLDKGKSVLAIDYCLTFLGYGVDPDTADDSGRNAAYPYESIYTTKIKSLGGEHCAVVKELYQSQGFKPEKGREALASDHIAAELEFMQFLASMELTALNSNTMKKGVADEVAISFAQEHILNWIDEFEEAINHFSETEFYKGLIQMTKGWLNYDLRFLFQTKSEREA